MKLFHIISALTGSLVTLGVAAPVSEVGSPEISRPVKPTFPTAPKPTISRGHPHPHSHLLASTPMVNPISTSVTPRPPISFTTAPHPHTPQMSILPITTAVEISVPAIITPTKPEMSILPIQTGV